MTSQNKAIVRAFIDAIDQQDWARFDELVAPDFVRHSSTFGQSAVRTRDQLRGYLAAEFKHFRMRARRLTF